MNPSPTDLAWFAGVIDGDGCIRVFHRSGGTFGAALQVVNTSRSMVSAIEALVGGRAKLHHNGNTRRRNIWRWYAGGRRAQDILQLVLPYLKVRRSQAEIVLRFPIARAGQRLSVRERLAQALAYEQVRRLNHGGETIDDSLAEEAGD